MKVEIPFREFLKIYIGKEFPDEFANAKDARGLKGANAKAKANAAQAIKELIQIAENKSEFPDYGDRAGSGGECPRCMRSGAAAVLFGGRPCRTGIL